MVPRLTLPGIALAALGLAGAGFAEGDARLVDPMATGARLLLYRPGILTYDNYGLEGYRPWPRNVLTRAANPIYDEFGHFLVNGIEVYQLQESRRFDEVEGGVFFGSRVYKPAAYDSYTNRLMVADDSHNSWSTRLIIGDRIRTHFSPLVLDLAALNGVRWDLANPNHCFTLAASRMDRPIFSSRDAGSLADAAYATYLLGGHWQGRYRTLELGASYANLFRVNSRAAPEWNGMKGGLPQAVQEVDYLVVRVDDSSVRDGVGVRVYDMEILLDGQLRPEIEPFVTRHNAELVNPDFPSGDRFFPRPIPPYAEVLLGRQVGSFQPLAPSPQGFHAAAGKDYLLYWFPIPEGQEVTAAAFDALVSGDYRIGVAEVFAFDPRLPRSDPARRNRATYYQEVAGSEGRGDAGADMKRLRFRYGRQTGLTVTGLRLDTDVKGFRFKAEWAHSFNFLQYPAAGVRGERHDWGGDALFLNLERELSERLTAGGEWFRLEPDYTTQLSVADLTLSAYTDPPGPFLGDLGTTDQSWNNTLDLNTVDDNDDKDPFPDGFSLPSFADNNGVVPGLDRDQDGLPDSNRNNNAVPDYFEPFLLYEVDPDDFDYGEDLNNNGAIDTREDDVKPDYPYDLNRQGYHLFLRHAPMTGVELTGGRYHVAALRGGMRSAVSYAKAEYHAELPAWGEVRAVDFAKRVRDDIADDIYRFGDVASFSVFNPRSGIRAFTEDELLSRNSVVNTAFASLSFTAVSGIFAEARVKHEANLQLDADRGRSNLIQRWSSVLRADYRWALGGLEVSPRYKLMTRKVSDDRGRVRSTWEIFTYPMVLARYRLTERSWLQAGVQGFPGLPSTYRNRGVREQDHDSRDSLLMLVNHFTYAGYDMVLGAGYQTSLRRLVDRRRRLEDVDFEEFFIRMVVGLEPIL